MHHVCLASVEIAAEYWFSPFPAFPTRGSTRSFIRTTVQPHKDANVQSCNATVHGKEDEKECQDQDGMDKGAEQKKRVIRRIRHFRQA